MILKKSNFIQTEMTWVVYLLIIFNFFFLSYLTFAYPFLQIKGKGGGAVAKVHKKETSLAR
jgi:hypothetical protein